MLAGDGGLLAFVGFLVSWASGLLYFTWTSAFRTWLRGAALKICCCQLLQMSRPRHTLRVLGVVMTKAPFANILINYSQGYQVHLATA